MDSRQPSVQAGEEKKYNIVTVVTFDYFPFFLIFLNSLFRNVNCERIRKIYVVADQLPEEFFHYLSGFEKVEVIMDSERISFTETHGESHRQATLRKLAACKLIFQWSEIPLLLIDSDSLFVSDIFDFFGSDHDLLVTLISNSNERHVRKDGIPINYIGSSVIFNKKKQSLDFIEKWLSLAEYVAQNFSPPCETPALNLLLESELQSKDLKIGVMKDHHVSADQNIYQGTSVIHLKSCGPAPCSPLENFLTRISLREWPVHATPANYLDAMCYERWLLYQRGYLQFTSSPPVRGAVAP
jgi:hypothetical protein